MGKNESEGGLDLAALAAAQRAHERSLGPRFKEELDQKEPTDAESGVADYDRLLKEARELDSRLYPDSAAADLAFARSKNQEILTQARQRSETQQAKLKEVKNLVRGSSVAKKVQETIDQLTTAVADIGAKVQEAEQREGYFSMQLEEIQVGFSQNELIQGQIERIDQQIEVLMSNEEVAKLVYAQADADKIIRDGYDKKARRFLTEYGYEGRKRKRGKEGQEFVAALAQEFFDRELERLGVNKIKDPKARIEDIDTVQAAIMVGIDVGRKSSPFDQGGEWQKVFKHGDRYGGRDEKREPELMLRGYLLAQMLDSANTSAPCMIRSVEHAYREDNEKIKRIIADMIPTLNRVKAAASVDECHPGAEIGNREEERNSPSTNIYFRPGYHRETFENSRENERFGLIADLHKYNYVAEKDEPIYSKELEKTPEGRKQISQMRAEYRKELKTRQKEVNEARKEKEEQRKQELARASAELASLQKQLDDFKDAPERAKEYEQAAKQLEELQRQKVMIEDTIRNQEGVVAAQNRSYSEAGLLARRRFLGKGAAAKGLDTANQGLSNAKRNLAANTRQIKQAETYMEQRHAKWVAHSLRDNVFSEQNLTREKINSKSEEVEILKNISYTQPVEIV